MATRAHVVERLVDRVRSWALGRDDVRAVALVGSWARGAPHSGSDVDFIILTRRPEAFTKDDGWLDFLADASPVRTASWGAVTERRVRLPSGLEVEFGIGLPTWASTDPVDPGTRRVAAAMQVVHDPDRLLARLLEVCRG